jgi:hypothetical protein
VVALGVVIPPGSTEGERECGSSFDAKGLGEGGACFVRSSLIEGSKVRGGVLMLEAIECAMSVETSESEFR